MAFAHPWAALLAIDPACYASLHAIQGRQLCFRRMTWQAASSLGGQLGEATSRCASGRPYTFGSGRARCHPDLDASDLSEP